MAGIALDLSQLVAIFLESMFYGGFLVLYIATIWVLINRMEGRKVNYNMLVTVSIMFALATTHLSLDMSKIMQAFDTRRSTTALEYYENLSNPLQVAKTGIYVAQTVVGDSFVIFRLYVVWGRNPWICAFPLILLFCSTLTGYAVTYELAKSIPGQPIFQSSLLPWITSFFSLTLCTNVICTALIAGRIWWTNYTTSRHGTVVLRGRSLGPVLGIVIESGAIYSAALLSLLVVYLTNSNGQYAALDLVTPLIGIVFSMIIVRVHLRSVEKIGSNHSHGSRQPRPKPAGSQTSVTDSHAGLEMRPLAVTVSQYVHKHTDEVDLTNIDSDADSNDVKKYAAV